LREADLDNVMLTGGEPMLYKYFPDLFVNISNKKGIRSIGVATNGFRYDLLLKLLAERNRAVLYRLQTSLDGPAPVHNAIRGSDDAFKLVTGLLEGVQSLNGVSMHHAIMTLSKFNLPYLEETITLANRLGTYLSINITRSSTDAQTMRTNDFMPEKPNDLTLDEIKWAINIWQKTRQTNLSFTTRWLETARLKSIIYFIETGKWHFPCCAGINDAVLYPDGSVGICETLLPIANLYNYHLSWKELWKKHPQRSKTCYCMWDCAMLNSLSKSLSGYRTLFASLPHRNLS